MQVEYRLFTILPRFALSIDPHLYVPEEKLLLRLERRTQSVFIDADVATLVLTTSRRIPASPFKTRILHSPEFPTVVQAPTDAVGEVKYRPFPVSAYMSRGWQIIRTTEEHRSS